MIRLLVVLLLAGFVLPAAAHAHERSASSSSWTVDGRRVTGQVDLQARQATLLLSLYPAGTTLEGGFRRRLIEGLALGRGGAPCEMVSIPQIRLLPDGRLRGEMEWACPQDQGPVELSADVFSPLSANHIHFTRLRFGAADWQDDVLTHSRSRVRFTEGAAGHGGWQRVGDFIRIGTAHILSGPDHLAFLCALLLVVSGWRRLCLVTAGFTVGHSATLALAVLGWIAPAGPAVEALIGFSILFLAAEAMLTRAPPSRRDVWIAAGLLAGLAVLNVSTGGAISGPVWLGLLVVVFAYGGWLREGGDPSRSAPALSAGFGLVHGVGFAGLMLELELAPEHRLPALFGFNLGVEIGQVVFIAATLLGTGVLVRHLDARLVEYGRWVAIAVLTGVGAYWFVERAWS